MKVYQVLLLFFLVSCNKSEEANSPSFNPFPHYQGTSNSLNLNSQSPVQVRFNLNDTLYHYLFNYGDTSANVHYAAENTIEQTTANSRKYILKILNNQALPLFSIRKGTFVYYGSDQSNANGGPTKSEFVSFFEPGVYPLSNNADFGVELNWLNDGLNWSTSNGSNESNEFVIQSSEYSNNGIRYYSTFDCYLYNYQGDSLHLESGELIGYHGF